MNLLFICQSQSVTESYGRSQLRQRFGELMEGKRIVTLDVPDEYRYMDEELVEIWGEGVLIVGLKRFCLYLAVAIFLSHQGMAQEINFDVSQNEYLLEEASCAKVLETLKGALPEVHFTTMPNLNGFYATGSESDHLKIQIKLLYLDRVPLPPGPPLREQLPEQYKALWELRGFTTAPQYPCDSKHYRVLYP